MEELGDLIELGTEDIDQLGLTLKKVPAKNRRKKIAALKANEPANRLSFIAAPFFSAFMTPWVSGCHSACSNDR